MDVGTYDNYISYRNNIDYTHPRKSPNGKRPGFPDIRDNKQLIKTPVLIHIDRSEYNDIEHNLLYELPNCDYFNGELLENAKKWYEYHKKNNNTIYWIDLSNNIAHITKLVSIDEEYIHLKKYNTIDECLILSSSDDDY